MDIWLPPTPAHVLGNMGQWEGQGAGERAAAPSALPLQEGMRQGVQFVHLLLDLQVGPLAEARGGADGSPSTHPAMGRWRSAPKCHSQLGSHTGEVTQGYGAVGPHHAPGSSPGWTSHCPGPSAAARSSSSAHGAGEGWTSEGSLGFPPGVKKHCPPSAYLGVEGQSFGVVGVHHGGIRLEDDALARGLEGSAAHGHQQVHHLGAEQGVKGQPPTGLGGSPPCPALPRHPWPPPRPRRT